MNKYTRVLSPLPLFRSGIYQGGTSYTRTQLCKPLHLRTPPRHHTYAQQPMYHGRSQQNNGYRVGGRKFGRERLLLVGAGGVLFGAYYFTHLEAVPISGRNRMIGVSQQSEVEMGKAAWEQIKDQFRDDILPANDKRTQQVKKLVQPIIRESGLGKLDWEVIVVDKNIANAFVLPGGKICVFTGIMKIATDPDEMATILSHEVAHVVARHNAEKWTFSQVAYFGGMALRLLIGDYLPEQVIAVLMHYGMNLPFSRKCESEADHIGLILMAKACYDPSKAVDLWTKFQETDKKAGGSSEWLKYTSTHPSHGDRVLHVKELLPQAYEARRNSHCERFTERMKQPL